MSALVARLLDGGELTSPEAAQLFELLVDPDTPGVVVGACLAALRVRRESGAEVLGLTQAMRARALPCDLGPYEDLVDVVGTGGDGASSFNLSTGSALLAAAAGCRVAKHGGGAVSGRSGSADVLAALGVPLPATAADARRLLDATGFTFLHAARFHEALRTIGPLRRALGTRTVFNLIGPLCNPASPRFAVIGAASPAAARALAEALSALPVARAFVVHGARGWDEPTPVGPFQLFDVRPGRVAVTVRDPHDAGLPRCHPGDLRGADAATNARALRGVLLGARGPHRDALLLGAALALEVTSRCEDMQDGIALAAAALDDGRAARLLSSVVAFSQGFPEDRHV